MSDEADLLYEWGDRLVKQRKENPQVRPRDARSGGPVTGSGAKPCSCGRMKSRRAAKCRECRLAEERDPQRTINRFKSHIREDAAGCWVWTASVDASGYARFRVAERDRRLVHRFAYETWVGPIPEGLVIDHLCRNRLCVNPEHLEAVTQRVNALRAPGPSRDNLLKTHCKHGHPFDEENTYWYPGRRERGCRTCRRERSVAS